MFERFQNRSKELEHIDKGDYTAAEYEGCIIELQRVNKWMGDAHALKSSLLNSIQLSGLQSFSVLDVGAGSGELLRLTDGWARKTNRRATLVGLELNARSAAAILEGSDNKVAAVRGNALQLPFHDNAFNYAICSLFTHHFTDAEVVSILRELGRVAASQIFVIDLHRHPIAYFLYTTLGKLVLHTRLLREDGALSILRSFKPSELVALAERADLTNVKLKRSFPFRLVLRGEKKLAFGINGSAVGLDRMSVASERVKSELMNPALECYSTLAGEAARAPIDGGLACASFASESAQSEVFVPTLENYSTSAGEAARVPRNRFDVIIAGAGPAGSSAAIHLAAKGVSVLLVEQKKFPRPKLCGEFISPECWQHFERLGVDKNMGASGGSGLSKTVFYSRRGQSVTVPSTWFGAGRALGLSRAAMDTNLLQHARECGVTVLEETQATQLIVENGVVLGASLKTGASICNYFADITIDATGRTRVLARKLDTQHQKKRAGLVAFKAHLKNAVVSEGSCELYFYPGGYGGLNTIEGGLSNLCFIVSARDVRRCESNPERLVREVVSMNSRAALALKDAQVVSEWLAVALETFGRKSLVPAKGLLTAGDASAFIDPFTGSGMLMALESGELVAELISDHLNQEQRSFTQLATRYREVYSSKFSSRLRVCSLLRRAAFVPQLAETAIWLSTNDWLRRRLSRAIRKGTTRVDITAESRS